MKRLNYHYLQFLRIWKDLREWFLQMSAIAFVGRVPQRVVLGEMHICLPMSAERTEVRGSLIMRRWLWGHRCRSLTSGWRLSGDQWAADAAVGCTRWLSMTLVHPIWGHERPEVAPGSLCLLVSPEDTLCPSLQGFGIDYSHGKQGFQ